MALIELGGGVTDIRGSVGGNTFTRNESGNIMRERRLPVARHGALLNLVRSRLSMVANAWSATLTEVQRTSWRTYAAGTAWTNRLGQSIEISGLAAFARTNTIRRHLELTLQTTAPVAVGHAGAITFTASASVAADKIRLNAIDAPWDKATDDDYALFYASLPMNPGVLLAHRRMRTIGSVAGDSGAPPAAPYDFDPPYALRLGQKFAIDSSHLDELGRLSSRTRVYVEIVA